VPSEGSDVVSAERNSNYARAPRTCLTGVWDVMTPNDPGGSGAMGKAELFRKERSDDQLIQADQYQSRERYCKDMFLGKTLPVYSSPKVGIITNYL
jgi:hypothetical protein